MRKGRWHLPAAFPIYPVRGRDTAMEKLLRGKRHISIHAPLAGSGKNWNTGSSGAGLISIHTSLWGVTAIDLILAVFFFAFQPTRQYGAQLCYVNNNGNLNTFQSTRPFRGVTSTFRSHRYAADHFNPRAPHGARQQPRQRQCYVSCISTHAQLVRRDTEITTDKGYVLLFQPPRPARGTTKYCKPESWRKLSSG